MREGTRQTKTFVVTAAQAYQNPHSSSMYGENPNAGKPNLPLMNAIDAYCHDHSAESIIQAVRGSYVNEIELDEFFRNRRDVVMESSAFKRLLAERTREQEKRDAWEEQMAKSKHGLSRPMPRHYFGDRIDDHVYPELNVRALNRKIAVVEPQTPSQNEDPCAGNRDLPQDYLGLSVIIPHPKQRLVSVPKDLGGKMPRILLTTGCCTYPNYNDTNSRGKKANRHHQYGFVVVDVLDPKTYLPRIVPALEDGTFVDLGVKYAPGRDPEKIRTKALVLGDIHVPFQNPSSIKASLEMVQELQPEKIFIHDLLDFYCVNHHNADNLLWRMDLAERGIDGLGSELEAGLAFLKQLSEVATGRIYVVPSNHDRFVSDWINSGRVLKDPKNMRIGAGIIRNFSSSKSIARTALEQVGRIPRNIEFLLLDSDQRPHSYECSAHGHLGIDGAKGTLRQFKVSYGRVVTGHTHTLEVDGHAISAGTNSEIPMEYQKGQPSKAMAGNVAIYAPDLAQAIPIIGGRWKK